MEKAKTAFNKTMWKMYSLCLHANRKVVAAGSAVLGLFIMNATPVLASVSLFDQIGSSFKNVYLALVALAPVVTGVAYVVAKIWQIIVPEKQGRAEPREWARNALVNYFLILAAGGILGFIAEVAGGIGKNTP